MSVSPSERLRLRGVSLRAHAGRVCADLKVDQSDAGRVALLRALDTINVGRADIGCEPVAVPSTEKPKPKKKSRRKASKE